MRRSKNPYPCRLWACDIARKFLNIANRVKTLKLACIDFSCTAGGQYNQAQNTCSEQMLNECCPADFSCTAG
eukprot:1221682-Karenia_brevis.AAC.1